MNSSARPHLSEVASVARRPFAMTGPRADRRLYPILQNESSRPFGYGNDIHAVFQELEDKDGHLFAVLQTRKLGVLARQRRVEMAEGGGADAGRALALCRRALEELPDFAQVLLGLLDALGKGVAVLEVIWRIAPDGAVLPARIVPRWPGRFAFDEDGTLRRVDPGDPPAGVPMPPRKFLVARFQPQFGEATGTGLCLRAYWYSWFKRNNLKAWALFNEKFGAPTVVAHFPPGADQGERDRLLDVVESLQQDAGIILPEGIAIDLLEAKRSGQVSTYRDLADWCNDEMSKIVLGQTLTTSEGRRGGARALGEVHDAIRNEYVEADARMLEGVINEQLLRWVVDFNLGADVAPARLAIDTNREERLAEEAEIDKLLLGMGVALTPEYFYARYRRPRPEAGARTIHYDDQNIFQYHLRFGVLTINEVRARLGYAPVPWGDVPVNAAERLGVSDPAEAITAAALEPRAAEDPARAEPPELEAPDEPQRDA